MYNYSKIPKIIHCAKYTKRAIKLCAFCLLQFRLKSAILSMLKGGATAYGREGFNYEIL